METLLSSDFWLDQMASALKAWAVLIPFIMAFFAVSKIRRAKLEKKNRGLKAYADEVKSRLQLAREENSGEAKAIAQIQTEISELRQLIKTGTESSVVEPAIKDAESSAAALVMANRTTDNVLTVGKAAFTGAQGHLLPRHNHDDSVSKMLFIMFTVVVFLVFVLVAVSGH